MTVRAQMRGHPVYLDGDVWRHTDDDSLAPASGGQERPCTHCGLTAEDGYGPDPCLGWGDGPACCGHGSTPQSPRAQDLLPQASPHSAAVEYHPPAPSVTPWPPDHPCAHRWRETSTEADRAAGLRHYECDCTARRTVRGGVAA